MSSMLQEILAFVLTTLGWVLVSSTLPTDYWKVSSLDGTVITTATFWSNLWKTCVTDSTGVSNCKDFTSMLALDGRRLFALTTCDLFMLIYDIFLSSLRYLSSFFVSVLLENYILNGTLYFKWQLVLALQASDTLVTVLAFVLGV